MKNMRDLSVLAMRDPLTHAFIKAWQMGEYPSFEAMLIDLACSLIDRNNELMKTYSSLYWGNKPEPTIFAKGFYHGQDERGSKGEAAGVQQTQDPPEGHH